MRNYAVMLYPCLSDALVTPAGPAGGRQTKATEKGNKSVNLGVFDNGQRAPGLQNNGKIFTLGGITGSDLLFLSSY